MYPDASTDPWNWNLAAYPTYCLTLTANTTPRSVLACYGTDPDTAVLLTLAEADEHFGPDNSINMVRTGSVGTWGFGIEVGGVHGLNHNTLAALSHHSETLCIFKGGDGTDLVHHYRNGTRLTRFEPIEPPTNTDSWLPNAIETHRQTYPHHSHLTAALYGIATHLNLPPTPSPPHERLPTVLR